MGLAGHRVLGEELGDAVLPLRLGAHALVLQEEAEEAAEGVEAVVGLREHAALRAVDDARGHLLAAVGGEAVHEDGVARRPPPSPRSSTWKPSKARCRTSASSSCPIDAQTSVCTASAPSAASAGRSVIDGRAVEPGGHQPLDVGLAGAVAAGLAMRSRIPLSAAPERQAAGHVVEVADPGDRAPFERPPLLPHREQVGERLARVAGSDSRLTTGIDDADGELLEDAVVEHPGAEGGVVAGQDPGDVAHRLPARRRRSRPCGT